MSLRRDARLTWRELLIIRRAKPRQRRRPPFFPPPSPFRRELLLLEGCLRRLFADWRLERFEKRVRGQSLSERIDPLSPPSLSLSLSRVLAFDVIAFSFSPSLRLIPDSQIPLPFLPFILLLFAQ